MLYSYAMGVDKSIYELEKQGFKIEKDKNNFMVSFPDEKDKIWEDYIKTQLNIGFWNEYISNNDNRVTFIFHLEGKYKKYVVTNYKDDEVLNLCEEICKCRFGSIEKMLIDNHFYFEKVFSIKIMKDFLVRAKKNTYANGNAAKVNSSRLASKDYEYEEKINGKKVCYHDTYFGGEKFIGSEVVYIEDKPIWAMNYYGNTINPNFSEQAMDNALRPALMQVGTDNSVLPLRGPSKFTNREFSYTFEIFGTMENFTGLEKIYKNNELIYELKCSGGIIK